MKIRSKKHRDFVASQPCIVTGYQGERVVAHHLLRVPGKGMGTKSCDSWTVPLESSVHDALHRNGNEVEFFKNRWLDYERVKECARELARMSPDIKIRKLTC